MNIADYKKKYLNYLKSEQWANIKLDLIHIRGEKCELCEQHKSIRHLQLHHTSYINLFNEKPGDLLLLCAKCHQSQHKPLKRKPPKKKKLQKKNLSAVLRTQLKELSRLVKTHKISVDRYAMEVINLKRSKSG